MQQWTQIQALLRIQLPNDALTIRKLRLTDFPVPLLPRCPCSSGRKFKHCCGSNSPTMH
ncbi:SEC-C metal-binding domain-containing protein [Pseudomonas amygdali]|uniref:SEC-C metal-binding domain-containing protein n=1 Tax=Pseudomonas amygdali TaxID=47877 RepID=UPI00352A2E24